MKTLRLPLLAILTAGLALAATGPAASQEAEFSWRLAVGYPRGVALGELYPEFEETIESMSGGRIEIEIVYNGEGVNQEQIFGAVQSGLVQMGLPYMALFSGEFPAGVVELGLPGGPTEYIELRRLFHKTRWKEILREGYAEHGLYLLGEEYQLPTYLMTKEPIESLEDLKGQKIRAPGVYGQMFRNLGAAPVVMAYDEVYTGLATGVIDGVDAMNIVDHYGGKFHEIAQYLYPLPVTGSQVFPILVNMDAWNELPDDLKAVLRGAANWHADNVAMSVAEMEAEALNAMRKQDLKMSPEPSPEDVESWQQAGQAVWGDYDEGYSAELIEVLRTFMNQSAPEMTGQLSPE